MSNRFIRYCQVRIYSSGIPYEQDLEHTLSLGPRQLYSLETVVGQQGAEAQDGSSSIFGRTSYVSAMVASQRNPLIGQFYELLVITAVNVLEIESIRKTVSSVTGVLDAILATPCL